MINYLKFVVIFGVTFGVFMGLMGAFGNHNDALYVGAIQGLFFGAFMAAWMVWWTRRSRLRLAAKGIAVASMHPRQERQLQMSVPPTAALEVCIRALNQVPKARIVATNSVAGTVMARIGMTWRSFGERVTITVSPDSAGSRITIASTPLLPTTMVDGGKGVENVETVLKELSTA